MAARFPQSASSLPWRIKPAWVSKGIKVVYWAAAADAVHKLLASDTATTVLTRSTSGSTFDSTNGVISGTNTSAYFSDSLTTGATEGGAFVLGAFYRGDLWFGSAGTTALGTQSPPDAFVNGAQIRFTSYSCEWKVASGPGSAYGGPMTNDVADWITLAMRHDQSDSVADIRMWLNGSEITAQRTDGTPGNDNTISALYFGATEAGSGNGFLHYEGGFLAAAALSDADLDAITADPSVLIEETPAPEGPTIDTHPSNQSKTEGQTATFSVAATTSGGSLSYQWQVDDGEGWGSVTTGTGGTTNEYTTDTLSLADDGLQYRCVVTDDNGSVESNAATLTVTEAEPSEGGALGAMMQHGQFNGGLL